MSAEVELISTIAEKKSWTRPPIQMEFQVPECFFFFFGGGVDNCVHLVNDGMYS